jgi:hypothetical protein
MTAAEFRQWLDDMIDNKRAKSKAECSRLLGITDNGRQHIEKNGSDLRTALACAALLRGIPPYSPMKTRKGKPE